MQRLRVNNISQKLFKTSKRILETSAFIKNVLMQISITIDMSSREETNKMLDLNYIFFPISIGFLPQHCTLELKQ